MSFFGDDGYPGDNDRRRARTDKDGDIPKSVATAAPHESHWNNQICELEAKVKELTAENQQLTGRVQEFVANTIKLERDRDDWQERARYAEEKNSELKEKIRSLESKNDELKKQIGQLQ